MSIYYSQAIVLETPFNRDTVRYIVNQGASLGFIFRTWPGEIVNKEKAIEYILQPNEEEFNNIFVDYQDTDFIFNFTGDENPPLYVSINPPNFTWIIEKYGLNWIDNTRYGRLLLYLSKDLPLVDFSVGSDHYRIPKPCEKNTIHVEGSFGAGTESIINAKTLANNIYKHNYIAINQKTTTNLVKNMAHSLENHEPLSFTLDCNSFTIKVSFLRDGISFSALEPYAKKIIQSKEYIDLEFYLKASFNIIDMFPIYAIECNFEIPQISP